MTMIALGAFYTAIIIATVGASPVPTPTMSPVAYLAIHSCEDGLSQTATAQPPQNFQPAIITPQQEVVGLWTLETYVTELTNSANQLVLQKNQWLTLMDVNVLINSSKRAFNIPFTQTSGMTAETNSRLYTMTQLAVYANFLKDQQTDGDYGPVVKQDLTALTMKLMKAVCTLKSLVLVDATMSHDVIQKYVDTESINRVVSLTGQKPAVKRAFTMAAVKTLALTLDNVKVVDHKSVIVKDA